MAKELSKPGSSLFEQIKRADDSGNEYWTARDMASALSYLEYRNFKPVIDKAKEACKNSGHTADDHFVDFHDMIGIGKGGQREVVTEEKLRKENIRGKQKAHQTHYEVGKKVRETIKDIGGTMPENLPVADSIKKVKNRSKPKLKKKKS